MHQHLRATRGGSLAMPAVRDEIQARMSDHAGFICPVDKIADATAAAATLRSRVLAQGIAATPERSAEAFRWRHMALLSEAVLTACLLYTSRCV